MINANIKLGNKSFELNKFYYEFQLSEYNLMDTSEYINLYDHKLLHIPKYKRRIIDREFGDFFED